MKIYEHTRNFQVKYCDVDFKDELKASTALAFMEEVAASSADELGFGYSFLKPKGYAFILSSVCMEFARPIVLGESLLIKTWPNPPSYVVFSREYKLCTQSGEALVNASSRWCLMDLNTGKILASKVLEGQDYSTYNTSKALENANGKIPVFAPCEGELKFTITIANSEYDHNMHVNNTRYADYCFNCFSVAELAERKLKRFCISYQKQCHEKETLRFYLKQVDENRYLAQGVNAAEERVVQAEILFE